jgi:hypothetical protein
MEELKSEEVNGDVKRLMRRTICIYFLNPLTSNLKSYNFFLSPSLPALLFHSISFHCNSGAQDKNG